MYIPAGIGLDVHKHKNGHVSVCGCVCYRCRWKTVVHKYAGQDRPFFEGGGRGLTAVVRPIVGVGGVGVGCVGGVGQIRRPLCQLQTRWIFQIKQSTASYSRLHTHTHTHTHIVVGLRPSSSSSSSASSSFLLLSVSGHRIICFQLKTNLIVIII